MTAAPRSALSRGLAVALLLVMGGLWGLQFAMLKIAAESGHSELNILMLTLVLLSVIFLCILVQRRQLFRLDGARLLFLLITGLLGYVAPLLAALHAAPHIPAGILALLASLTPIATISVAFLLRSERVSPRRILAVLLGVLAVLLVLWPQVELPGRGSLHWMLVALVVPFCYGVESVYIAAAWPRGMTALQAVTGETVMAAFLVAPIFALYGEPVLPALSASSAEVAIAVFVAAGVVESLLYFYLIRHTGGVFVSFGTFVSLFAGIGWGVLVFSEAHGFMVWVAVAVLCLSLGLACLDRPATADVVAK